MVSDEVITQPEEAGQDDQKLPPEMVRKVADRVYQLLKEEARVEHERFRPAVKRRRSWQGGR